MLLSASTAILEVVVVAVVPISSMVVASMVVHRVVMLNVSSKLTGSSPGIPWIRGVARLLLSAGVELSNPILSLAVLHLLMFPLQDEDLINQLLVVVEGGYHQLNAQLIIQSFQELFLLGRIIGHISRCITGKHAEIINVLGHSAIPLA